MGRSTRTPRHVATGRPTTPGRSGPSVGRAVSRTVLVAGAAVLAVVLAGAGAALADGAGSSTSETWTPTRADVSAPPVASSFTAPNDVHVDADGSVLVADLAGNGVLRRATTGVWSVVAPFGTGQRDMWNPSAVTTTPDGRVLVAEAGRPALATVDPGSGAVTRQAAPPVQGQVAGLAVDGTTVFAAVPGSGRLWTAQLGSDTWTTVAGPWQDPAGVARSADGTVLTVTDARTDDVWRLDRATGAVVSLGFPRHAGSVLRGVAVDGGDVFVVDNGAGRVWARTGGSWSVAFSTAPDGTALVNPTGVSVGADRSLVVADYNRQRIVTATSSGRPVPVPSATPSADPTPAPTAAASPGPSATRAADSTAPATALPTAASGTTGTVPPGRGPVASGPADGPHHARDLAWTGSGPVVPVLVLAGSLVLLGTAGSVARRRRA